MKHYLLLIFFFCLGYQFSHAGLLPVDQQQKKKKAKKSKRSHTQKIYKLEQILKKTKNEQKKQRLEHRIKKSKQNLENRKPAKIALIFSIIAAGFYVVASLIWLINRLYCYFRYACVLYTYPL